MPVIMIITLNIRGIVLIAATTIIIADTIVADHLIILDRHTMTIMDAIMDALILIIPFIPLIITPRHIITTIGIITITALITATITTMEVIRTQAILIRIIPIKADKFLFNI